MSDFCYRAYGLVFRSNFQIECLLECEESNADVRIVLDAILNQDKIVFSTKFANWQASEDSFFLQVENIANYLVRNGNEIRIQANPSAEKEDITAFLISSAFAALLQQRKLLTLHASAVATERGAVLFVGRSGVGKSTTLTAMVKRGYPMIADDVAAIKFDSVDDPRIISAFPITRLRENALDQLGISTTVHKQVRTSLDKYLVPVESFEANNQSIRAIFILDIHESLKLETKRLSPTDSFFWLSYFTFRKRYYDGLGLEKLHFKMITELIASTPVHQIKRPDSSYTLDELLNAVIQELETSNL